MMLEGHARRSHRDMVEKSERGVSGDRVGMKFAIDWGYDGNTYLQNMCRVSLGECVVVTSRERVQRWSWILK